MSNSDSITDTTGSDSQVARQKRALLARWKQATEVEEATKLLRTLSYEIKSASLRAVAERSEAEWSRPEGHPSEKLNMCKVLLLTVTIEIICIAMAAALVAAVFLLAGSAASIGPEQPQSFEETTTVNSAPKTPMNKTRQFCKTLGENDYISCENNNGKDHSFCCKTPTWHCCNLEEWKKENCGQGLELLEECPSSLPAWMYAIIVVCIFGLTGLAFWLICTYITQLLHMWWVLSCRARRTGYEEISSADYV